MKGYLVDNDNDAVEKRKVIYFFVCYYKNKDKRETSYISLLNDIETVNGVRLFRMITKKNGSDVLKEGFLRNLPDIICFKSTS